MRSTLISLGLLAGLCTSSYAQNPNFQLRDGQTFGLDVLSYPNDLIADAKFLNAKADKKEERVAARNADIVSGKTVPSRYSMTYKVTKETGAAKGEEFKLATNIGGKEYASYNTVTPDTLFLSRNKGFTPLESGGENLGYTFQGTQRIPFNIKVGDKLPVYEDVGLLYPKTSSAKVKEWLLVSNEVNYKLWMLADVEVRRTVSVNAHTLNNVGAIVTRTEPVEFGGKTYNAFVIESETWMKSNTKTTIEASEKQSQDIRRAAQPKFEEKMAKKMVKQGFTNPDGYVVTSKEEWFVPELGIVKTRAYDMYGAITTDMVAKPGA